MKLFQNSKILTGVLLAFLFSVFALAGCAAVDNGLTHKTESQPQVNYNNSHGLVNIHNESKYVIECSQMIGGYCSQNPVLPYDYTKILPDPGSLIVRGHIMVFSPNTPGKYIDNIIFKSEKINGVWHSSTVSLYHATNLKVKGDSITISAN